MRPGRIDVKGTFTRVYDNYIETEKSMPVHYSNNPPFTDNDICI